MSVLDVRKAKTAFLEQLGEGASDRTTREFVLRELTDVHMRAALWLNRKRGMTIDARNLCRLIEIWEDANKAAELALAHPGAVMLMLTPPIPHGQFHPAHLIQYFKKHRPARPCAATPVRPYATSHTYH